MSFVDTPIACFEMASIVRGYRALHVLTQAPEIRVLEASPAGGGRFLIVAQGAAEILRGALAQVRGAVDGAALIDQELVEKPEGSILEAMYSLTQVSLEEALVVLECETVSALLASAQLLVHTHKLKPIEIKVHRSGRGGAYGFFTGKESVCNAAVMDVEARLHVQLRKGDIEVIVSPTPTFREFFNFSGEA